MSDVAIVGAAHTAQGELAGRSANSIAVEAVALALADAGLQKSDLDGLITCQPVGTRSGTDWQIGAALGIRPQYSATLEYGSCNFSLHLAVMAIRAGFASTIALVYGANHRTGRTDFSITSAASMLGPASGYLHIAGPSAMAVRRYQHLYGLTEEEFGWIAVGQREWAQKNPLAVFTDPLPMSEYLRMPYMVAPLRRPDITMISDGGVALIVTSTEHAADLGHPAVEIVGMAQDAPLYEEPDALMRPMFGRCASRLYEQSGVGPAEVDVLYVQEPTALTVLQALEAFGFCKEGEAGGFLAEGHTRPGGDLPVNTNGGQLSESYMWGWLHLVEAVRQLRGDCGDRQVEARTALYCSSGGFAKCGATALRRSG
ncbi:thiolase family protein [Pseudonocardia xishanensis]|uniref:Thiolase n=1 Tax=Pseudonocardia xishanensis TaxID=630995 RepID=A0ABP8RZB8_9PSEU